MNKYLLSFTAATVLPADMRLIAQEHLRYQSWDALLQNIHFEIVLGRRTLSTSKRIGLELVRRLRSLDEQELSSLVDADPADTKDLSWVAVCRTYDFIRDFMIEVVRDRYLAGAKEVTATDYMVFFSQKTIFHPELISISETTQNKLRQVLFKMMEEVDILEKKTHIVPTILSSHLMSILPYEDYACFPMFVREN